MSSAMSKRPILLVLVAAAGALAVVLWMRGGGGVAHEAGRAEDPKDPSKGARTLLPSAFPGDSKVTDPPGGVTGEGPRRFAMAMADEPALSGLEVAESSDDDRTRAGVTEQFGRGVTIARIHPDAPAAEVALEVGDVIVRAETENISSVEDLRKAVGSREHTMITFARQGQLLTVVLQKPFASRRRAASAASEGP
jgi:hypothetical protein